MPRKRFECKTDALSFAQQRSVPFLDLMRGRANGGALNIKRMAPDEEGQQLARLSVEKHIVEFHFERTRENPAFNSEDEYLAYLARLWPFYPDEVLKAEQKFL